MSETPSYRPPSDEVAGLQDESSLGLDRRVCPNCRLFFDVEEDSDAVFCCGACEDRHERGVFL
jgi:hypothetical protein